MSDDSKILTPGENTFDILMQDDEPEVIKLEDDKPKKEEKPEDKEETGEEELEIKDEDEKDEEVTDESDELIVPPRVKDITEKYPNFLKEFPFFKQMMFKDRDLTEMGISTIDDAKELVERVDNFSKFEQDLFSGKTSSTLAAIKTQDPGAYGKIVDNYLGTLYEVDPQACAHVINNLHRQTIKEIYSEGQKTGNKDLETMATLLHQWVFGNSQWQEPASFSKDQPKAESSVNKEREEFTRERFESAKSDITERFDNALKATIAQNIDPKNIMPAFVKKNAIAEALRNINSIISSDRAFKSVLDKKWQQALKSNFNKDSMNAIKTALLSRAKPDLKDVILRVRKEAMDGLPARAVKKQEEEREERPERDTKNAPSAKKGDIPKGMSNKDFIMAD